MKAHLDHQQTPVELIAALGLERGKYYRLQADPNLGGVRVRELAAPPDDLEDGGYLPPGKFQSPPEDFLIPEEGGVYAWAAANGEPALLQVHLQED